MKKIIFFALFLLLTSVSAMAQLSHEFIGASKCAICHKKPEQGGQFGIWQQSAHAKAFDVLGTPEAKEQAAKMGVDDPQKSGKCLKCHSAAYGLTEEQVSQAIKVEEGVSCESCHGPGKDYMKMSVMKDKDAAVAAGLQIPDEATCKKCHNEQSPTFKGFDFAAQWEKIKHPLIKK